MAKNDILNFETKDGLSMYEKFNRLGIERRIRPVLQQEYIQYNHRYLYDDYNLMIGDTFFMIPPEFITISSESRAQKFITLRQENTQKVKNGYHNRIIYINLVFNSRDEINGFMVKGPYHKDGDGNWTDICYVDGLRQLLAQFKFTPFLPITNELINGTYGIATVALQSITMSTVEGFPDLMKCQVVLQEANLFPYIEMPDLEFQYMIDWDLYRYYIQSFMTDIHEYRKFQALPENKDHRAFRLSILDELYVKEAAYMYSGKERNIVKLLSNDNCYIDFIDSSVDNIHIIDFQCGYQNLLTNVQLAEMGSPTIQFLGGMDTIYNITFETTDADCVRKLEQCQITNDLSIRNNPRYRGACGFVKLQCDLVEFTGSLFVMVEKVETNTVPGLPGLFSVRMNCVSYDVAQSRRESLNGFKPFEGSSTNLVGDVNQFYADFFNPINTLTGARKYINIAKLALGETNTITDTFNIGGDIIGNISGNRDQTISQDWTGWNTKTTQDNYAEWKIRTSMEVYPDLMLPTYSEVDEAISMIRQFRQENNLPQLQYDKYPLQPTCMIHGSNPNDPPSITTMYQSVLSLKGDDLLTNLKEAAIDEEGITTGAIVGGVIGGLIIVGGTVASGGTLAPAAIAGGMAAGAAIGAAVDTGIEFIGELFKDYANAGAGQIVAYIDGYLDNKACYQGYVDPDFYVFYPDSESALSETTSYSTPKHDVPKDEHYEQEIPPDYSGAGHIDGKKADQFVALAKTYIGHTYVWGAEGEISDAHGECFDCSGFITFLLKKMGIMPNNMNRLTCKSIPGNSLFKEIPWSQRRKSDLLVNNALSHVVIYEGPDKTNKDAIVHAANSRDGVKESNLYFTGRCFRIKAFEDETIQGTDGSDPYADNEAVYPSLDEPQDDKSNQFSLHEAEIDTTQNKATWNNIKSQDSLPDYAIAGIMGFSESVGLDANTVWNEIKNDETVVNQIKTSTSSGECARIIAMRAQQATGDESVLSSVTPSSNKAMAAADSYYNVFSVEKSEQADISGLTPVISRKDGTNEELNYISGVTREDNGIGDTITNDEYDSICRVVGTECQGEPIESKRAMAQLIYDRLTIEDRIFGGITNILGDRTQFQQPLNDIDQTDMDQAYSQVYAVFCGGARYRDHQTLLFFASDENKLVSYSYRNDEWTKIGTVGTKTYWGREYMPSTKRFSISGSGVGPASSNYVKTSYDYKRNVLQPNTTRFGNPILFKANMDSQNRTYGDAFEDEVNSSLNRFNTSFVNQCQYAAKGRLLRAFPAFLFCILDENMQWFDGRKLWTNYYVYKSLVSIGFHAANDMPTSTATITVTNTYHNLDRTESGLEEYSVMGDKGGYGAISRWLYKNFGMLPGGVKITKQLIELHEIIYNHAKLREDARIHLRMGYGSDPFGLAPIINGNISSVELGDEINIIVTSDGHELLQDIISSKEKDTNNGFLGLFGLFEEQEASDIIANCLIKRASIVNALNIKIGAFNTANYFEESKYHIEHFGLYMRDSQQPFTTFGGTMHEIFNKYSPINVGVDIDFGIQDQYDMLKNIYRTNYEGTSYMYPLRNWVKAVIGWDSEKNIVFSKFNMTPWDLFAFCAQTCPEFIISPNMHQFDSRIYFGMPFWMEKYRYDLTQQGWYEECKASAQAHYIDSLFNIIDNRARVTSQFRHTNVKVMYVRGGSPTTTGVLHSDVTIDNSKQKTVILDTPVVQDALGPDLLYEICQYKLGRETARAIGVSDLLMSWEKEYQGELLILGDPGIMPNDYLLLNDRFTNLFGVCKVREVIHNFDVNSGFTTGIVLGLLSFNTIDDTGHIAHVQNLLKAMSMFLEYSETRRNIMCNYEKNIGIFASYDILQKKMTWFTNFHGAMKLGQGAAQAGAMAHTAYRTYKLLQCAHDLSNVMKTVEGGIKWLEGFKFVFSEYKAAAEAVQTAKTAYETTKDIKKLADIGKAVKEASSVSQGFVNFFRGAAGVREATEAVEAAKGALEVAKLTGDAAKVAEATKNLTAAESALATAGAAGGAASAVASAGITIVIALAIQVILDRVFEWLEQRNMVTLLPLWYYEQPWVAGIKGGKDILIMGSLSNATEEGDNVESSEINDEDQPYVEDN